MVDDDECLRSDYDEFDGSAITWTFSTASEEPENDDPWGVCMPNDTCVAVYVNLENYDPDYFTNNGERYDVDVPLMSSAYVNSDCERLTGGFVEGCMGFNDE